MTKKQKYYVVWEGNKPGIYFTWQECQKQIFGHPSAKFKSFDTLEEAEKASQKNYFAYVTKSAHKSTVKQSPANIIQDSIATDAACSGNPGDMEYQCVETISKKLIFCQGPFKDGTNNVGEFLALVHALALLHKHKNSHTTIYTDSVTAISWVKNKKVKSNLEKTKYNQEIFDLIERAESWLKNHTFSTPILKWDTKAWGENPADFGRK